LNRLDDGLDGNMKGIASGLRGRERLSLLLLCLQPSVFLILCLV
jgi:hypothetical protein